MRVGFSLAMAALFGTMPGVMTAHDTVRFDRPIFTTETTVLCARQQDIAALRRASNDNDRATIDRITSRNCKQVAPDIRLTVVAKPGLYDPDVEVRVASAPDLDPSLPRGKMWTLKSMVRN
jgi:hypothetical protein